MHLHSERGAELVSRWNAGDRSYVIDQLADDFVLRARLPKLPVPARSLTIRSKTAFRIGLWALRGHLPKYTVVTAMENSRTIFLMLEDPERRILAVTIKLNADGLFSSIGSFRPENLKLPSELRAVWMVRARNPSGGSTTFACGTDVQVARRVRSLADLGFDDFEIIGTNGETRDLSEFEHLIGKATTTGRGLRWAATARARRWTRRS